MTDKSANMFNESVSALMDGENSELDLRRILKRSASDDDIKHTWHRYHLASQVMRAERMAEITTQAVDIEFLTGIQTAIAGDAPYTSDQTKSSKFTVWRDGFGKFAVAASVAFAVLVGFQYVSPQDKVNTSSNVAVNDVPLPGPVVPAGFELPTLNARTVSSIEGGSGVVGQSVTVPMRSSSVAPAWAPSSADEQALQQRLQRILLKHAESSAESGGLGVLPFARLEDPALDK